jgi:hypothetical protein
MLKTTRPRMNKTVLSAHGTPAYLTGDSSTDGAGCWLHFEYLASKMLLPPSGRSGWQSFLFAALPEPSNPFDANAVALSLDNHHVGYLPATEAKLYSPSLATYIANGFVPFIRGKMRAYVRDANHYHPEPWAYVYMSLCVENVYPPERIEVAALPGAAELARDGGYLLDDDASGYRAISGTAERSALEALIQDTKGEYALARLVLLPPETPGKRRRVGVQWCGLTVARLSAVSSDRYLGSMICAERKEQLLGARIRVPRWPLGRETEIVMVFIHRELALNNDGLVIADKSFLSPKQPAPFHVDIGVDSFGPTPVTVSFTTSHPALV